MADGLQFDAERHIYTCNGRVVPGVTSVLEPLQFLDGVPWAVLEAARDFGSNVHLACHLFNTDKLDEAALDPALKPYLDGWIAFLNESGFHVMASEAQVHSRVFGYAGTADAFGTWQNTSWVVDIKSGVVPDTVGAQLAAYQHAARLRPRRRLCVQLTGDGRYRLHEQKDLSDFALFQSALNIYRYRMKRNKAHVRECA